MGTGCSSEVPPAMAYDKSKVKDDSGKDKRSQKNRKHSTTSSSDVNVKVNKPKPLEKPVAITSKGTSYTSDLHEPTVGNSTSPGVSSNTELDGPGVVGNSALGDPTNISSTLSTTATLAPKLRDQWKLPPRLASLTRDLQDLLLGHNKEPAVLIGRPQVIHLKVIVPGEECMAERAALWSNAFMPLRTLCAEKGYLLDIQDDLWLSQQVERASAHLPTLERDIADNATNNQGVKDDCEASVDVLVVVLTDVYNYRLPPVLSYEDYTLVVVSSPDSVTTALFHDLYANNENRVPPAYELVYHILVRQDEAKLNRLVDLMMAVFEREQKDINVFNSDYYNNLKWVQQTKLLVENTVVVFRSSHDINERESTCNQSPTADSTATDSPIGVISTSFEKECPPENCVQLVLSKAEDKKKDNKKTKTDVKTAAMAGMTSAVKEKLEQLLLNEIRKREECIRETATGVPRSLIEELVTQTKHYQRLTSIEPLLKSSTLISLQDYVNTVSEMPIVVYAEAGWGLSTLGAQLVTSCLAAMPTSVIIYRSMGISPDSRTLLSTLLSIRQQLDTILGPCAGTWCNSSEQKEQIPAVETLLSDIVSRSSNLMPLLIILEGISLTSAQLRELDVMTMTELLPSSTKMLVMTSDPDVSRGLRTKMRDAFYVKASQWDKQSMVTLFTNKMNVNKRALTESQKSAVIAAIKLCPLPMYAVTAANLAASWRAVTEIRDEDLPGSMEGILTKLFEHLECCISADCFSCMMACLSVSVGGISNCEMTDLLSVSDSALVSIYPEVKDPPIHRAPPILWSIVKAYLRNYLNIFISKYFYIYSWTSSSFRKCATGKYVTTSTTSNILHRDISDYFMGRWTNKQKLYPGTDEKKQPSQDRLVMPQPDLYGKHFNVRKFMCLPFHLMNSKNKNAYTLEICIFNLPWIENKLNSTSVLQVVCDLEQAKLLETSCSSQIKLMQQALLLSSNILQVHGGEVYKCLQYLMTHIHKTPDNDSKSSKNNNGLAHFFAWLSSPPGSFLYPLDYANVSLAKINSPASHAPIIDAIVPVSKDMFEPHVVVTLKSEQEIRVINIITNQVVRTLTEVDHPQNLIMLDSVTAVVLCNRELAVIDLDEGKVLVKLRGVLNLRMPFFGLQNDQKVVALSRDRMVVNILDINTGAIVATFKAGETRFLDSLIISGDGKVLVCGDETQKPFPLLVWSLEQSKLLHDIRIAQHEFVTQLAAITYNGHYLACGCREVGDSLSNFVAIYDLISGQLFKKIKMTGLCTAVALASKTMCVLLSLDTGQLAVWDLALGNHKFLLDGVGVVVNNIILAPDEKICLTTCTDDCSISSHTVSLWNIDKGHFVACHTFDCPITCAQFTPDSHMVLVGIAGHPMPIRLLLVPEGRNLTTTKAEWEADKDAANAVFGNISRKEAVINVGMEI